MACPILCKAGTLTNSGKYFDQAVSHFQFIQKLCQRDDGLYRHSPQDEAAWGRGNGFPALGLTMMIEDLPGDHPARPMLIKELVRHLEALRPHQDDVGMWHQVIDHPESYAEFTSTCMISYSIARGLQNGWLNKSEWDPVLQKSWIAIKSRIGTDGELVVDSCTGTGKQKSVEAYFDRKAILGRDDRAGAMALLFAWEMQEYFKE